MNKITVIGTGMLLCIAISGCTTRNQSPSIDARIERQDQQLRQLSSQVVEVEQVRPNQAEMWSQLQTMRQEINILNGKLSAQGSGEFSDLRDRVSRLESLVRRIASQLAINADSLDRAGAGHSEARPSDGYAAVQPYPAPPAHAPEYGSAANLAYPITPDAMQPAETGSSGSGPALVVAPDGALSSGAAESSGTVETASDLYDSGIKAFDERRYKEAVVIFKDFASTFPKHTLAGNAYFWQGESYYQIKDYPRAALAYQEVISKYPGSPKIQSAMLKQGISLYHADKKAAARERLQELVKRYPNSPESTRAKQFLADNK